jgi:hypothetical protein
MQRIEVTAVALILGGALFAGVGSARGEGVPIYKCLDRNLGIVYTDLPCKDGEKLDLRAGDADPAAVARLERDREELNLAAAQRIADERRAALQRDLAYFSQPPIIAEPNVPESSLDYGYGYPLLAYPMTFRQRPPQARPRVPPQPRFAPNPPFVVPRQQ